MFKTVSLLVFALIAATVRAQLSASEIQTSRRECRSQLPLICNLGPTNESNVTGTVIFRPAFRVTPSETNCWVRVNAIVTGLPGTRHGFHIHEYGDISSPTGISTGGHFLNPEGTPVLHGLPRDVIRHWGDFGNLRAVDGVARFRLVDRMITLRGIVGRGLTVHIGRDRGSSEQPSGASGPRIATGAIGFANPSSIEAFFSS